MKGLLYYDNCFYGRYTCKICGAEIKGYKAWVYKEGDMILPFCGDCADCRDEFLNLNNFQNVGDEEQGRL